jgi:hypothetical protein
LGQLRICFAATSSITIQFDAVGDEYYFEVVELLLAGIDPARAAAAGKERNEASLFENWPLKFRNEAKRYRPSGQRLLAAVRWTAIFDQFQRQIAPAGALLITEREMVVISDEREIRQPIEATSSETILDPAIEKTETDRDNLPADVYEFSESITFIPRVRLASFQVHHQDQFCVLALQVHGLHGGAKLEINFPSQDDKAVLKALEQWSQ